MQKFTRPLTREIELGGERLALTMDEKGMSIRLVGARKAPLEISWSGLLGRLGSPAATGSEPTPEEVSAAIGFIKAGGSSTAKPPAQAAEAAPAPPAPAQTAEHTQDYTALLARLEAWLGQHRPHYLHGLQVGASAAVLDQLQHELGLPLPVGLRTLLHWHNGQREDFVGSFVQSWLLLSAEAIAKAKKELDADASGEAAKSGWQKSFIPFLDDNGGDYVCLDTSEPNAPVREFWLGKPETPVVAPSLAAWLESFVTGVERGDYHETGVQRLPTAGRLMLEALQARGQPSIVL